MAAFSYDDYGASESGGTFTAILNWGGAVLSLVLIAGLATWGWKLWVRDVSGIPVVQALEGPMRIAPEEPGGLASEYQGLTVNRIAEERVEETPSEQVVLAPAPATLDEEEDLAMAALPAVAPEPEAEPAVLEVAAEAETMAAGTSFEADTIVVEDAGFPTVPVEEESTDVARVEAAEPAQSATDMAVAAALADLGLKPEPAVLKVEAAAHVPVATPRPAMRPVRTQPVSFTAPERVEGEADPFNIPAGTRLVQLGAYSSADVARGEWSEAEGKYSDYFTGKTRVIQEVDSGGRQFYRLRVMGFEDLADARRFCAVIVADGTNCIPVIHQ